MLFVLPGVIHVFCPFDDFDTLTNSFCLALLTLCHNKSDD